MELKMDLQCRAWIYLTVAFIAYSI